MSNADDLRRLAEEIAGAYEERVRVISDVKQATADIKKETGHLLNDFGKVHAAMSKELKDELARFKSDLDAAEGERKKTDQAEVNQRSVDIENLLSDFNTVHQEMADNLRTELARFKSDLDAAEDERRKDDQAEISERKDYIMELKNKARELIDEFDKAHGDMAQALRAELAGFKSDLDAAEDERKKEAQAEVKQRSVDIENLLSDFDSVHQEMADSLRTELARFKSDLDAGEDERKKRDQGETRETAEAWRNLLSTMQAARGRTVAAGPAKVEAAVEVKTVEEAIEEPAEEAEKVEEAAAEVEEEEITEELAAEEEAEEDQGGRILDLLEDNDEGLKMTQIADMLGIENWRTLIPVMRELMDGDEIRKEGTLYFPSE